MSPEKHQQTLRKTRLSNQKIRQGLNREQQSKLDMSFFKLFFQMIKTRDFTHKPELRRLLYSGAENNYFRVELYSRNDHVYTNSVDFDIRDQLEMEFQSATKADNYFTQDSINYFTIMMINFIADNFVNAETIDKELYDLFVIVAEGGDALIQDKLSLSTVAVSFVDFIVEFLASGSIESYYQNSNAKNRLQDSIARQIKKFEYIYHLLEIAILKKNNTDYFWWFLQHIQPINLFASPEIIAIQEKAFNLLLQQNKTQDKGTKYFETLLSAGVTPIKNLIRTGRHDFISKILIAAKDNNALCEVDEYMLNHEEEIKTLFNFFFSSKISRDALCELILHCPLFYKRLMNLPYLIFTLVKKREKKMLGLLLKIDLVKMKSFRDNKGNGLLLYLCSIRGKILNTVQLLIARGFDINQKNSLGQDAKAIAKDMNNSELVNYLSLIKTLSLKQK